MLVRRLVAVALLVGLAALPARAADEAAAERLLKEAIAHYDWGRFEASLRALGQAERATGLPSLLARIHLYRGVNHAVLGQSARAKQDFAEALKLDPQLDLDPNRFKPAIVQLLRSARAPRAAPTTSAASAPAAGAATHSGAAAAASWRPFAVALAIGGALGLGDTVGGFKLGEEIGYRFSRAAAVPALGLAASQAFGGKDGSAGTSVRVNVYQVAAKLWWDLRPLARAAFCISPLVHVGYAYLSASTVGAIESASALSILGGVDVRLVIDDRWLLFLRPLGIDVMIGSRLGRVGSRSPADDAGVLLRYDLAIGAGATF